MEALNEGALEVQESNRKEGFIEVPGGKVWYSREGNESGTPLIVVHGGPGDSHVYLDDLQELGDEREIIFYDQLGSGKSDRPTDPSLWKPERFVEELNQVISSLNLKEYNILGQSWGAGLSARFVAEKQPKGLKNLILANPYLSNRIWKEDTEKRMGELPMEIQETLTRHEQIGTTDSNEYKKAAEIYEEKYYWGRSVTPAEREKAERGFNESVFKAMFGTEEEYATGTLKDLDVTDRLTEIKQPVLLITGRYDFARPETVEGYKKLLPRAEMSVLEKSAHMPFITEKDVWNNTVREFLRRENASNK